MSQGWRASSGKHACWRRSTTRAGHPKDPDASSDITEVPTWYRCEPLPFSILEGELAGRSDPVREG